MQEIEVSEVERTLRSQDTVLSFIHSPFCGTCHLARRMLQTLEAVVEQEVFLEWNASLHPSLMERYQIKSVPCLLVTKQGIVEKKIYAFHSVSHMYEELGNFVK
ncbi:Thioredoxin [Halobacillus dabanensis]|uniref:Thioredoxin n=1 Tax=Halobacillus dabanensis TaxID=240302 RepID=A0A1I3R8C1_HALDA|nr:thioredoxin family protein [Halobacillus dabanensis]SFJ41587.1 Thioredoxin [Halobacillus dabanensis]